MSPLRPGFTTATLLFALALATSACADTVPGKVVGPDGKPVPGAKVFVNVFSFTPQFNEQATKNLTTDASGGFEVDVPPAPSIPELKDRNLPVARVLVAAPGFGYAQTSLTLRPSDSNTIHLQKGVPLRGKVVDAADKPVAGADVRLQSIYLGGPQGNSVSYVWLTADEKALPGSVTKTDADGSWTLADIPAKAVHASVTLADTKYVQVAAEIPLAGAADKSLVARPAAVLVGKVVGKDGKPRPGISVSARQENYGAGMASAVTSADGSYRLSGLPAGAVAVWVHHPTFPAKNSPQIQMPVEVAAPLRQVPLTEGKETTVPDLVLVSGGVVEGTVTDAVDGKPIPNAQIMVPDNIGVSSATTSSVSDSNGKFALRLPPGKYRLSIPWDPEGYLKTTGTGAENVAEVNITEGTTVPAAFRLARALTLSGVAQDAGGKPVSGVEIAVMEQGNPPKATADSEGKWTLKGIKPGNLRLVAANDYEIVSGNEVTLSAKEPASPVTLMVKPFKPAPLTGRVVTTAGAPVAGVKIQALTKMTMGGGGYWFDFQESHTDDQGRFTLPPVRAENPEVKLTFNKPGYKAFSGGTLTRQGDRFIISEAVMGALDRGRTLKGRVVDAAGKPVANAIVAATGVEVGPGETRTDAVGKFILAGVPEESRLLAARGALFGSVPVTRKTAAVTVRLAPAKKAASSVSEDHARARAIIWDIKKRYVASTRQNLKVDDFALRELPLSVAPLDFPLALALAKPEGTNPVDDQTLAQMIREVAQHNPSRLNDWALPALKGIGVSAVRASAAYAAVHGLPEGPAKTALAKQVYAEMQTLTLTGSEHWVVRRLTQMAVLAAMLGQPDESTAWLDKAIAGATEDKDKPYIGVVAHESVSGGLPVVRYVLAKVDSKLRTNLYWEVIAPLARLNARAAQKLLGEMEADSTLTAGDTKNDYARSRALLELVRALAPQDPTAALSIAEQLIGSNHSYSSAAIALSAQGQPDVRKAALLYQRAASLQDATGSAEVLGKIASLAWKNDPAMGEKLFRQANQVIKERNTVPNTHSYGSMVNLAKAVIDIKPGESRLMLTTATGHLLSSEGRKEDTTATYRQTLALAWLPFSADQAMAIAEKLPEKQEKSSYEIRNSTLTKIAVWLLTDPSKRTKRLLAYYDQYGFDTPDY